MTLPFQKLPLLVIQIILETMGFFDLFILSCTSAKTKRIVKKVFKIQNHKLLVFIQECVILEVQSGANKNYKKAIHLKSERDKVGNVFRLNMGSDDRVPSAFKKSVGGRTILSTYWSDPKSGFNVLYNAVSEVFKVPIQVVTMNLDNVSFENYQNVIDWIEKQFPTVPAFQIVGSCSFQNYIWLMRNTRAKNEVFFMMEPTEYPENHEIVNLEMEEIRIEHGRWMKLQDLQAIRARTICINRVFLKDNEINTLFKNLDAFNERSNLKKLILAFYREADLEIILEGLDVTNEDSMKPEDTLNQWSFKLENGQKCTVLYSEYIDAPLDVRQFGFEIFIEG